MIAASVTTCPHVFFAGESQTSPEKARVAERACSRCSAVVLPCRRVTRALATSTSLARVGSSQAVAARFQQTVVRVNALGTASAFEMPPTPAKAPARATRPGRAGIATMWSALRMGALPPSFTASGCEPAPPAVNTRPMAQVGRVRGARPVPARRRAGYMSLRTRLRWRGLRDRLGLRPFGQRLAVPGTRRLLAKQQVQLQHGLQRRALRARPALPRRCNGPAVWRQRRLRGARVRVQGAILRADVRGGGRLGGGAARAALDQRLRRHGAA